MTQVIAFDPWTDTLTHCLLCEHRAAECVCWNDDEDGVA